jgi:hypothetical protein
MSLPQPDPVLPAQSIVRPPCPRCNDRMMLTRIEPHTPGYELRTFECPTCDYSGGEVVKFE